MVTYGTVTYACCMRIRLSFLLTILVGVAYVASSAAASAETVRWFHSPTGNIECEVASGGSRGDYVYCQTFTPLQTVTLRRNGRSSVCSSSRCSVGNGPDRSAVLGYGLSVR